MFQKAINEAQLLKEWTEESKKVLVVLGTLTEPLNHEPNSSTRGA